MDSRRCLGTVVAALVVLLVTVPSHSEWLFDAGRRFEAGEWPDTGAAPITVAFVPPSKIISVTPRVAAGNAALGTVTVYDANIHGELSPHASYSVPGTINDIAFGLINRDKKRNQDLVVASSGEGVGYVVVMMATNYGVYGGQTDVYDVGSDPRSVAVGQVNDGDSHYDLVVVDGAEDSLRVLVNDGTGDFPESLWLAFPVGDGPRCVALGDFDDDSYLDAVIAEKNDGTIRVLFNTGDEDLFDPETLSTTYSIGGKPYSVCVDDFDQDGNPDIAATTGESLSDPEFGKVVVLFNDGSGDFSGGTQDFVVGYQARSLTTGRFDAGPYPDIAVTGMRWSGLEAMESVEHEWVVSVLVNKEPTNDASFESPVSYLAEVPRGICAGKLDNDTHVDLLVGMDSGEEGGFRDGVTVFRGAGDGTLKSSLGLYFAESQRFVEVVDLNDDGYEDVLVTGHKDSLAIFLGDGSGGFSRDTVLYAGRDPKGVEADDLDGDGFIDLVVAARGDAGPGGCVTIRYGSGEGEWEDTIESFECGWHPWDVEIADFDYDGWLDIAVGSQRKKVNPQPDEHEGGVCVLYGGEQGFDQCEDTSLWSTGSCVYFLRAGDVDGDDYSDLVAAEDTGAVEDLLLAFRGGAAGLSDHATFPGCRNPWGVDLGDLNGDELLDVLVVSRGDTSVLVYLADPEADWEDLYSQGSTAYKTGVWPMVSRFADVDGDGNLDFAVNNHGHVHHHTVTLYLGRGDGSFEADPHDYVSGPESSCLDFGQLNPNVDSHLDMVVAHETTYFPGLDTANLLVYFGRVGGGRGERSLQGPYEPVPMTARVGYAPNPSRESTRLTFSVPQGGAYAEVTVYDVGGRYVRRLVDGYLPAGEQAVVWDGKSEDGSAVASGVYFCRIVVGEATSEVKIALLR